MSNSSAARLAQIEKTNRHELATLALAVSERRARHRLMNETAVGGEYKTGCMSLVAAAVGSEFDNAFMQALEQIGPDETDILECIDVATAAAVEAVKAEMRANGRWRLLLATLAEIREQENTAVLFGN